MDNLNEAEENARLRESLPNNYCPPIKFVSLVRSWGEKGIGWLGWFDAGRNQGSNRYFSLFLVPVVRLFSRSFSEKSAISPGLPLFTRFFSPSLLPSLPTHPPSPVCLWKNLTDEIHSPSPAVCTGSVRDREGVECRVNTCRFGARCQRMAK